MSKIFNNSTLPKALTMTYFRSLPVCFFCVTAVSLLTLNTYAEQIELVTGDILEGTIEKEEGNTISIRLNGGVFHFKRSEIAHISPSISTEETAPEIWQPNLISEKEADGITLATNEISTTEKIDTVSGKDEDVNMDAEMSYFIDFFGSKEAFLRAFTTFKQKAKTKPDDINNRYQLGLSYFYLKQYTQAAHALAIVIEHNASDLEAMRYLAYAYYRTGHYTKAIPLLEKILESKPFDLKLKKIIAFSYQNTNNIDNAITYYTDILTYDPLDKNILLKLAKLYTQKGNAEKAKAYQTSAELLND